ncbi:MAG: UDP-N-acetylmuramoyl-L-alanine--D-glutamate ligase [Candidatus Latescibacteria bacterium]|nr:UDP-N-acetylmuramoyl-L-alanine--D-glutamate ligase [Candidatus Latescibacterota bacterium]
MIKLIPGSAVAIIGIGRVGRIITHYLMHNKINVYAYDDNIKVFTADENQQFVRNVYFKIISRKQWPITNLKPKFAIVSPGLPEQASIIRFLETQQIPIIDEIEFTSAMVKNPIIAITGTNGKSTATVLLGKILAAAGQNVFWGGNLAPGLPFATSLFQEPKDTYIIEVSSFQLSRCHHFHPHIAVITNITADHLDRHVTFSEYQKSKFRIFSTQKKNDYAILNHEDESSMKFKHTILSKVLYFSRKQYVNGVYLKNNKIFFKNSEVCSLNDIKLFGKHYLDSVLAVITAAKILNINNRIITKVLRTFTGLEHRLQFLRQHAGIKYINNSMCTNPVAAAATLESFTKPVILIAGGKEKNLDPTVYIKAMTRKAKFVVLFGENQNHLSHALKTHHYHKCQKVDTIKEAVLTAKKKAAPDDVILFSPGFASFDKYRNFQERGLAFSKIVYAI